MPIPDPVIVALPNPGPDGKSGASDNRLAPAVSGFNRISQLGELATVDTKFNAPTGVFGHSTQNGVTGFSESPTDSGVFGLNDNGFGVAGVSQNGVGVLGQGGRLAGEFRGNVHITGRLDHDGEFHCAQNIFAFDVSLIGADCAEEFNVSSVNVIDPGTVMVIDDNGAVKPSEQAYDKRVAGVISGAGNYRAGITLDKQNFPNSRKPIALVGKVYCKVDAGYGTVAVGDLLTTSPTPGYAMNAKDRDKAFGAVIGKALQPLESGQSLIPILVALQ